MTRRNLFRTLTAAVVASSMEVMGWEMPKPTQPWFHAEFSSPILVGEGWANIAYHHIHLERLLPRWDWNGEEWKKPLPHGMGDNFKEIKENQSYETKP